MHRINYNFSLINIVKRNTQVSGKKKYQERIRDSFRAVLPLEQVLLADFWINKSLFYLNTPHESTLVRNCNLFRPKLT